MVVPPSGLPHLKRAKQCPSAIKGGVHLAVSAVHSLWGEQACVVGVGLTALSLVRLVADVQSHLQGLERGEVGVCEVYSRLTKENNVKSRKKLIAGFQSVSTVPS